MIINRINDKRALFFGTQKSTVSYDAFWEYVGS